MTSKRPEDRFAFLTPREWSEFSPNGYLSVIDRTHFMISDVDGMTQDIAQELIDKSLLPQDVKVTFIEIKDGVDAYFEFSSENKMRYKEILSKALPSSQSNFPDIRSIEYSLEELQSLPQFSFPTTFRDYGPTKHHLGQKEVGVTIDGPQTQCRSSSEIQAIIRFSEIQAIIRFVEKDSLSIEKDETTNDSNDTHPISSKQESDSASEINVEYVD